MPHPAGRADEAGTVPTYAQNTEQTDMYCSPHAPQLLSLIGSCPGFNEVGTTGLSQKSPCHSEIKLSSVLVKNIF
jgi:hypothetical protein